MSDEIQAIATNNYVLATQQAVTHDNSMSGNGTVDSPLGVVPGYNETVLYEYSGTAAVATGNLSESVENFEMLRLCFREATNGNAYQGGNLVGFIDINECQNGNNVNSGCVCISFHNLTQNDAIGLRYGGFYLTSPTSFTSIRGERPINGTSSGTSIGNMWPTKVIGINRKAQ